MSPAVNPRRLSVSVRDMLPHDLVKVLAIERASHEHPWSEQDLRSVLRRRSHAGIVAVSGSQVVGFLVFEALLNSLFLTNLAVHPRLRRRGVGRKLLGWLCDQLGPSGRCKVRSELRESSLDAQLFLRSCGLRAVDVVRDYYEDTGEDCYRFERDIEQ